MNHCVQGVTSTKLVVLEGFNLVKPMFSVMFFFSSACHENMHL
jgi:hypothetical protein